MDLDPAFAVLFIWDVENTIMGSIKVPRMMHNISGSLKQLDPRYHIVEKVMVGNQNLGFIKDNRNYFHRQKFVLIDAPHRERICPPPCGVVVQPSWNQRYPYERPYDAADRIILGVILDRALENRLPPNILLASSDSDFTQPLKTLRDYEYNLMLAADVWARPALISQVMYVWRWERMYNEEGRPTIPFV